MVTAGLEQPVTVAWRLSDHARRLITLAVAGLLAAVLARRPEFAGLAAPAVLLLLPGRAGRTGTVTITLARGTGRLTEGDQTAVMVKIGEVSGSTARIRLHPAAWITADPAVLGEDGWYRIPYRAHRWGVRPVGTIEVILHDRWRLAQARFAVTVPSATCYPEPARLSSRVVLSRLPARLGEHPARAVGEGAEFAGVREFVPGDRQRRINWPATTRRGTLQLNTFSAERAQVVVILMDVSMDVGEPGSSSADLAARAAAGAAMSYLAVRDRVGLICFGRRLRWLTPATGRRQADRILGQIMADPAAGEPLDAVTRLPKAALPPGALILVMSPLLTLRLIETLRELRERGFAVIVIDVLTAEPSAGRDLAGWLGLRYRRVGGVRGGPAIATLARRVWRMEQDAIRFSLRELGIPVVHWDGRTSLDEPLAPYSRRALVIRT